jgi:hypothetical protein
MNVNFCKLMKITDRLHAHLVFAIEAVELGRLHEKTDATA